MTQACTDAADLPEGTVQPRVLEVGGPTAASRLRGQTTVTQTSACAVRWWIRAVCVRGDHLLLDAATVTTAGEQARTTRWNVALDVSDPSGQPPSMCDLATYRSTEAVTRRVAEHCWTGTLVREGPCNPTPPEPSASTTAFAIFDAAVAPVRHPSDKLRLRVRVQPRRGSSRTPGRLVVWDSRADEPVALPYAPVTNRTHPGSMEHVIVATDLPAPETREPFELRVEFSGDAGEHAEARWCYRDGSVRRGACSARADAP